MWVELLLRIVLAFLVLAYGSFMSRNAGRAIERRDWPEAVDCAFHAAIMVGLLFAHVTA